MTRKYLTGLTTALMLGAMILLTATVSAEFTSTSTTSSTSSETDADGNITETTIIERTVNGETTKATIVEYTDAATGLKYLKDVPVAFENNTDFDIAGFFIKKPDAEEWGENLLSDGLVIASGEEAEGFATLTVIESGCKLTLRVEDADGSGINYESIELSDISKEKVVFTVEGTEEEGYTLYHSVEEVEGETEEDDSSESDDIQEYNASMIDTDFLENATEYTTPYGYDFIIPSDWQEFDNENDEDAFFSAMNSDNTMWFVASYYETSYTDLPELAEALSEDSDYDSVEIVSVNGIECVAFSYNADEYTSANLVTFDADGLSFQLTVGVDTEVTENAQNLIPSILCSFQPSV